MTHTRRNVWELGDDWAEPILWYARGVAELKKRSFADATSWRFYGGIHGFSPTLWELLGFLKPGEPLPSQQSRDTYWEQCQHGSWYFLPWHRGYVLAFEKVVRAAIVSLHGPDTWCLPYWNYFKPGQNLLPPAFGSPDWPDGKGDNPLFVVPRYGPNGNGDVFVDVTRVNLHALNDPDFTGVSSGGSPGFGGVDTGFSHGGKVHGRLETQPHDAVHGLVGGAKGNDRNFPGAMSKPATAGLDPIFWLHHCNIDRLWESWNMAASIPPHTDPVQPKWLQGPAGIGQRPFVMPKPDGTEWTYTPDLMRDIASLGYDYDDLTPGVTVLPHNVLEDRMARLGIRAPEGVIPVPGENVELVGANDGVVRVVGDVMRAAVRLDPEMRGKVTDNMEDTGGEQAPDRVFLDLEEMRGRSDTVVFDVYVGVPDGDSPESHPELLAGSIAPFGLSEASDADGAEGGGGLTYVLEITDIVDRLHLASRFDVNELPVDVVPLHPVADDDDLTIGRISIFRQGR